MSASYRGHWIPLHEELVRCGFIDYAEQRRLDGHEGLFLSEDTHAAASRGLAVVRRWLSRLTARLPLSRGESSLTSLRLSFLVACVTAGICRDSLYRLMNGRAPAWAGKFEGAANARALAERMTDFAAVVRLEGLELSHLYVERRHDGAEVFYECDAGS